jgi:hypothetical protein
MRTKRKATRIGYGHFTSLCAHDDCGRPATHRDYGMDRCAAHVADLNPAN